MQMINRARTRRTALLIAATAGGLVLAGCGTAQTTLPDQDTINLGPARCPGGELIGVGTTVQHNAIDQVAAAYATRCDEKATVRYTASGAAAGVREFLAGTADWAGTDAPLAEADRAAARSRCTAGEAWSLPMVAGPVAIVFNLPGITDLTLSAPVLGQILSGGITQWNDPAIAALNPGAPLPAAPIGVVGRSDANGLTTALTGYLAANDAWPADRVGAEWSGTGTPAERFGVLSSLRGTANTLGYVEFSAARDNGLSVARLDSGAGPVELTAASAAAGLATADIAGTGGDLRLTPRFGNAAAGAYPVQTVSYQAICTTGLTPVTKTVLLRDFLGFVASDQQQAALGELGYTPLPESVRGPLRTAISQVR